MAGRAILWLGAYLWIGMSALFRNVEPPVVGYWRILKCKIKYARMTYK
jgi:hypothetical protein